MQELSCTFSCSVMLKYDCHIILLLLCHVLCRGVPRICNGFLTVSTRIMHGKKVNHTCNYMKLHPYWHACHACGWCSCSDVSGYGSFSITTRLARPFYWLLAGMSSRQDPKDDKCFIALLIIIPHCYSWIILLVGVVKEKPFDEPLPLLSAMGGFLATRKQRSYAPGMITKSGHSHIVIF